MKKISLFFSAFLLLCIASVSAQVVGSNAFLQGRYLEIGMYNTGGLGAPTSPITYHSIPCCAGTVTPGGVLAEVYDIGHDGWAVGSPAAVGDFTMPGLPTEGWMLQINGARSLTNYPGGFTHSGGGSATGAIAGYSNFGGSAKVFWVGSAAAGQLVINMETCVDTLASAVRMTVKFWNTGATPLTNIYYFRGADADNTSHMPGGSSTTNNAIVYQADALNRAFVRASTTTPAATFMGLGAMDSRARVMTISGLFPTLATDLAALHAGTGATLYVSGSSNVADQCMGITFNIGTIPAGDSATFSYAYIFNGMTGFDSVFMPCGIITAGTVIPDDDTVCGTTPLVLDAVGYSGPAGVGYQWQFSADSATWTDIAGATSVPYTIPSLTGTYYYRLVVNCLAGGAPAFSPGVRVHHVTVCPCTGLTAGTASASVATACPTTPITLNASGYTSTGVTLQWQSSPDGSSWTDISGATTVPYTFSGLSATTHYRLVVTCIASGVPAYSTDEVVTFTLACPCTSLVPGSASASTLIACTSTPVTLSATGYTATGTTLQWQSSPDGSTWTNIAGATTVPYTLPGIGATTHFRLVVTCISSGTPVSTAGVVVTYTTACPCLGLSAGVASSNVSIACTTTSIVLSDAGYTSTGTTLQWQSSADSMTWTNIAGATTVPYSFTGISATTYYRLVVTCISSGVAMPSAGVKISFNPVCVCATLDAGTVYSNISVACPYMMVVLYDTGYTATGTTVRWQSSPDNTTWTDLAATSVPYAFAGLTTSTYYRLKVTCVVSGAVVFSASRLIIAGPCPPTGVSSVSNHNDVVVYPNPVSDELTIETPQGVFASYSITNAIGQQLMQQEVNGAQTKVNVKALAPGIYYLSLKGAQGSEVRKFVKK